MRTGYRPATSGLETGRRFLVGTAKEACLAGLVSQRSGPGMDVADRRSNRGCGIVQHGLESRVDGDRRRRPPREPGVESFGRASSDGSISSTRQERESTCQSFPVVRESGCRWPPFSSPRRDSFPADPASSGIEIWIRPRAGFREIPVGRPNVFARRWCRPVASRSHRTSKWSSRLPTKRRVGGGETGC